MKKILAFALSALLLLTVCASLSASADAGIAISVDKATGAAGEDVVVNFNVDSNSGFWGLSLDVAYDTSVLTLKKVDFADAFKAEAGFLPVEAGAEKFTINAAANSLTENVTLTGVLATATFTIAEGATEGAVADITVTFNENNQIDVDMNNVPTTVSAGSVTVKKAEETTKAPEDTTKAPEDTTKAPEDTTAAPTQGTDKAPDTGSALPIAAIVLAAGSAAVLTFARKK